MEPNSSVNYQCPSGITISASFGSCSSILFNKAVNELLSKHKVHYDVHHDSIDELNLSVACSMYRVSSKKLKVIVNDYVSLRRGSSQCRQINDADMYSLLLDVKEFYDYSDRKYPLKMPRNYTTQESTNIPAKLTDTIVKAIHAYLSLQGIVTERNPPVPKKLRKKEQFR